MYRLFIDDELVAIGSNFGDMYMISRKYVGHGCRIFDEDVGRDVYRRTRVTEGCPRASEAAPLRA